jgi:hypothetical protein
MIQYIVALAPLYLIFFSLHLIVSRSLLLGYLLLILSSVSLVLVMNPEATTSAANALGVGRATDLLVYLLFISMVFVLVSNLIRFRNIDRMITSLARESALATASKGDPKKEQAF